MERASVERILIGEDDPATLGWLLAELSALPGVYASGCASVAEARRWLRAQGPHIVLTDLGLPDGSGIDVIGHALRLHPQCEVLVISIFGDDTHVVGAIEAGASGCLLNDSSLSHLGYQLKHLRDGGSRSGVEQRMT